MGQMETGNEVFGFESGNRGHIDRAFFRKGNMQGCVHDFRAELLVMIPKLRAFARLLSCDANEAEELSLKVVAEAWRSPPAFGLETNLKAWLFAIARNEFHANRRHEQREAPVEQAAQDTSGIMRALRLLPDAFREALILVVAGSCSYREAAKICGCPVGTVKSRVFRARQALVADFHTMPAV